MTTHRFRVGETVQLIEGTRYLAPAAGAYEVVRQLPDSEGEPHYRVKSRSEAHERVVKESQLRKA
ncbi:MAG TPA: hypothetical protein VIH40_02180 [Xanthobacteraceae bacterium]